MWNNVNEVTFISDEMLLFENSFRIKLQSYEPQINNFQTTYTIWYYLFRKCLTWSIKVLCSHGFMTKPTKKWFFVCCIYDFNLHFFLFAIYNEKIKEFLQNYLFFICSRNPTEGWVLFENYPNISKITREKLYLKQSNRVTFFTWLSLWVKCLFCVLSIISLFLYIIY